MREKERERERERKKERQGERETEAEIFSIAFSCFITWTDCTTNVVTEIRSCSMFANSVWLVEPESNSSQKAAEADE